MKVFQALAACFYVGLSTGLVTPNLKSGHESDPLVIQTTSGIAHGAVNASVPGVRHWLGIPFAQAPLGALRFQQPQPLPSNASSRNLQNQYFGANCPQYEATTVSLYTLYRREYFINGDSGDDCLSVSIWAPETPISDSLPVIIWVYGGGETTGGSSVPYQNPQRWVARTQAHIVVSIQYRVNFFGSPNTPLQTEHLAVYDARAAVEWIRDNIAAFGGNPAKMVLMGQSAGGGIVDSLSIGWPDDPIVTGFIQDSGSSWGLENPYTDPNNSNFTFIAEQFGCTGDAANMSACLSTVHQADIEALTQFWVDTAQSPKPELTFQWKGDNQTTWNNYTDAYVARHLSPLPKIILHNLMDGASLAALPPPYYNGPTKAAEWASTLGVRCPSVYQAKARIALGYTVYRGMYSGNFSNVSPLPWMGAYHSSELPMFFGTYGNVGGPGTAFQSATSQAMQDFYLAFVNDPENGMAELGWSKYNGSTIMNLGGINNVTGREETSYELEAAVIEDACDGYYPYYFTP